MRDEDFRRSSNIEDRRGSSGGFGGGLGGGFGGDSGIPVRKGGGFGFIIIVLLMLFFGGGRGLLETVTVDSGASNYGYQNQSSGLSPDADSNSTEARTADRVARVLGSTEDYWAKTFEALGGQYSAPTLVLFRNRTSSPCGAASGATGPFYCPGDQKIYLDLAFFDEMVRSLGARGDFAQAYVVAHEVAHHVQNEVGVLSKAHKAMARGGDRGADSVAVRLELQADCYAGTWAKNAVAETGALEPGDIEEAMGAASAVGDDRLQKRAQGYAVPDSFTHGTSEQRVRWFKVGLQSGDIRQCDTFSARSL